MHLKNLLFELTKFDTEINKMDAEFMDRVVIILNKLHKNEQGKTTNIPRRGKQNRKK